MSAIVPDHSPGLYGTTPINERIDPAAPDAVRKLDERVNHLVLMNMALWSLMKETHGLSEEVLLTRMREIDMADGHLDGQIRETATPCANCGRMMSLKQHKCLYCGYEPAQQPDAFGFVQSVTEPAP